MFVIFLSAFAAILTVLAVPAAAQRNIAGEVELRERLDRLATLGSVMMIGAHPDDENTALLAYFARGRHMRTAYLSLTRGEGGQNLIGSDQGDELGIIRTQELLAARRIDGGEQFFTRAIDFGFSKTPEETLEHWPREKVLGDIVWNIRRFRPDLIVLRFSGTSKDGHGHHQVSAILGREAFSAAADPRRFPEQLALGVEPWQTKRMMYNVLAFGPEMEKEAKAMADRVELDVGEYNPVLGYSYGEIAGMSRSQHRSQGMGAPETKGSINAYLVTLAGDKARTDPFEGINTNWNRLPGGDKVFSMIDGARGAFQAAHPEQVLQALADVRPLIAAIKDPAAERKLKELDEAIFASAGVWLEASAEKFAVTPGSSVKVNTSVLVRSPARAVLSGLHFTNHGDVMNGPLVAATVLTPNQPSRHSFSLQISPTEPYSQPYWLTQPKDGWLYTVLDPKMIGKPENDPVLEAHFKLRIGGAEIEVTRPVHHRFLDHVYGEMTRPFVVAPAVAVDANVLPLVFPSVQSRTFEVPIKSNIGKASGDVRLELPAGWKAEPAERHFELTGAGQQTTATFEITPPSANVQGEVRAVATVGDRKISSATEIINYPHIPIQMLFPPAAAKLVRAEIKSLVHSVGYIVGAGDEVPDSIRQMGVQVTELSPANVATENLAHYDAIVTGVRAWNTRADIRANYQRLFDYVSNGGTLIVQYNVPETGPFGGDASLLEHIGPLPITLSRDRVVEEDAPVTFPNPANSLLHAPNAITAKDFEGWIQERGLNFAATWDPKYQSVLESHDKGENPLPGGELYLRHGKGVYIFTAYSWFRELPGGVAGAYRLFANMLSAGKLPEARP